MRWVYVQQMEELADEVKKLKYEMGRNVQQTEELADEVKKLKHEVGLRPTDGGTRRRSQETQV